MFLCNATHFCPMKGEDLKIGPSFGLLNPRRYIKRPRLRSSAEEAPNRSTAQVMAGTLGSDAQKQFLTLIRNFATEKSQGERRIVSLKKRIEELRSEAELANSELEDANRTKETTEQELKGYEVELALSETSIQSLKSRISLIQDEISTVGTDLEALKNEEGALRDEFTRQMFELNANIRKFQETFSCNFHKESSLGTLAEEDHKLAGEELNGVALSTLEDMVARVISQTTTMEEEYLAEQNIQRQTQKELIDCDKKVSLIEVILKATRALQDLSRYPFRKFIAKLTC